MDQNLSLTRDRLLKELRSTIVDESVLNVFASVPRHAFIPFEQYHLSYKNTPLSIGDGQTISQPLIVCIMIELLELKFTDKVMDVGSGSGYQTALLAESSARVIGVERIQRLIDLSKGSLDKLGYTNVEIYNAVEELGYPTQAPYDAIIVGAAAPKLPLKLIEQLAPNGRLVIPVGDRKTQELIKVVKTKDSYYTSSHGSCRFVPLIGKGAWH
jgi:protein-L-isoaspartate(D-aspartate) O-methyltransferase